MKDLTLPTPALPPLADEIFHAVDNAMYAAGISAADRRFVMDSVNASASVRAALSHHEDGGRAEPVWCSCGDAIMPDTGAKCGVCASGVALGGEKGEAVADEKLNELLDAYAEIAHQNGVEFCAGNEGDLEGELTAKRAVLALFAATVCKARMLTDLEITRCWEATFGYLELGIAIQHKFCEKNGIEVLS